MGSAQRTAFESAIARHDWEKAANNFSALATFEMLPALENLSVALRSERVNRSRSILSPGAADRVRWVAETIQSWRVPSWTSSTVHSDQVQYTREFLERHTRSVTDKLAKEHENERVVLSEMVRRGRILGAINQVTSVAKLGYFPDSNGRILHFAEPMCVTLAGLAERGVLALLSLMRYGGGPRGRIQADGTAIGSAMDVSAYSGDAAHRQSHVVTQIVPGLAFLEMGGNAWRIRSGSSRATIRPFRILRRMAASSTRMGS
jgi:hypothetical protein